MKRWSLVAVMALLMGAALSGHASATQIASGTVPYLYSNGSGSGTIDYFGYTEPGNPLQSEGATETFLGAAVEWTYRVNVVSGEVNFLNIHLGSEASSVLYLENPDSADYSFFNASTCTFVSPCTTASWHVYIDSNGTIKWDSDSGISAGTTSGFFEFYTTDPAAGSCSASVGDNGETDVNVGCPSTVPEPASLLLLGSGLAGLGLWARRRNRQS